MALTISRKKKKKREKEEKGKMRKEPKAETTTSTNDDEFGLALEENTKSLSFNRADGRGRRHPLYERLTEMLIDAEEDQTITIRCPEGRKIDDFRNSLGQAIHGRRAAGVIDFKTRIRLLTDGRLAVTKKALIKEEVEDEDE